LTNYGGGAYVLAVTLGITIKEAEEFQRIWFSAHPNILEWHKRINADLQSTRTITNKFGYRRYYFERIDGVLKEALAWIPQSTVGLVINHAWDNVEDNIPWAEVLLQVHDSLCLQIPREKLPCLPELREQMLIEIPYDDPLVIPVGVKAAFDPTEPAWGQAKEIAWDRFV
jgi:DNA polymerase I-like protein with 3'-5' exonuclease and polymerase domains